MSKQLMLLEVSLPLILVSMLDRYQISVADIKKFLPLLHFLKGQTGDIQLTVLGSM
jgi:hypothetical protein